MKIAFVVGMFPRIYQTFVLNQATGLMDLGHEVDIFSFTRGDTKIMDSDVKKYGLLARTTYLWDPLCTISERIRETSFVKSQMLSRNPNPSATISLLNFLRFIRKAVLLMTIFMGLLVARKGQYDIIHCQFGGIVSLRFLPLHRLRILGGKLIVHFRGNDITGFVDQRDTYVYQKLFQKADYFLAVCDYFRKRAVELGCPEDKILVLRSGIDCSRFAFLERRKPARSDVKIAFVGRLVKKKGIGYAIRAVTILKHRGYHVKLLVVGDGPLKQNLSRLCRDLAIENRVGFLGAKNQEEIIKVLNTTHLFVAPSVTVKTDEQEEGIPNVLKEAMATGLPVVSTHHAGIPELVQDGVSGFLVPERDYRALADKLAYLIDHPERWPEMGKAGRKFVERNYDKEKLNRELVDIYNKLINIKK